MNDQIIIPKSRVTYFRDIIDDLEREAGIKINIDGNVVRFESEDLYTAKMIILAIARGFDLNTALVLKNLDYSIYIIDLKDYFNTNNRIKVIKGRIIGTNGSIKKQLEDITDSYISIYNNTVSVIAPYYSYEYVVKAINMILQGSKHSTVLNFLSRIRDIIKLRRLR
ncbi:MAG: hypothetical protein NZ908_01475 [Candidatus Micrarchaeota archaeon]|nr:hypothetical protein [Candidatus Micrarchaeota archaeon]MCX8154704.1 hypothetical protein [Candidatus Micrarchaeota archaeon]